MASTINFDNHVRSLNSSMRGMQRILYVGTDCDITKYPALCGKGWRCIYMASRSPSSVDAFSRANRQVRLITTRQEFNAANTKLDRTNPMVIAFNGIVGSEDTLEGDVAAQLEREDARKSLLDTLGQLLRSGLTVDLVLIGYNPDNHNEEIFSSDLLRIASKLDDSPRISFYGMSPERENNEYIKYMQEKGLAQIFTQDLGEAFEKLAVRDAEDADDDHDAYTLEASNQNYTVYINGEPKLLPSALCDSISRFGRILTLGEMATHPISRMLQTEYFYKFLKSSPNTPQWYGYTRQNGFAVRRDYEDSLYDVVRDGLANNSEAPVILSGQTSSGKSIALAALAYRFFQEHKYPVIFISEPNDALGSLSSDAGIALDNALKEIRDLGGRALVIMDWSVYNLDRMDRILPISNLFLNRGHNVLFVASAICANPKSRLHQVVEASPSLSAREKKAFKELMIDKGKLQRNRVEHWMEMYSDENGLLSMLYRLLYELHPQLEQGIRREIASALDSTETALKQLDPPQVELTQPMTAMAIQLLKAGFDLPSREASSERTPEQGLREIIESLRPFSECVAVATLYKLRMPMTLAMKLLKIPECKNSQAYRDAIFNAPWIYCAMDDSKYAIGEYFVSFRDPTDARIYINSLHMDEAGQMGAVARTIEAIQGNQNAYYNEEIRFLERLIRIVGPNSEDQKVSEGWRQGYGRGCLLVIDALSKLRENGTIEPQLVAQEITYIREYYSNSSPSDFAALSIEDQITHLENAIRIAREIIDKADRCEEKTFSWQQGLLDSIMVESVFSELRLERCLAFARAQELAVECKLLLHTFSEKRNLLLQIIQRQPENSYAYTALISCFLFLYEDPSKQISEQMLEDLSSVLAVVDATESTIPVVEQNSYYQAAKTRFFTVFDRVFSSSSRASEYFDKLLSIGSPVGIYMKARSILRSANVDYNSKPEGKGFRACAQALDLLEDPQNRSIVETHAASQYLRLHLTWLIRNKQPIFGHERQATYMQEDDWIQLGHICRMFKDNFFETQIGSHYYATICYVLALSCAQLGKFREAIDVWKEVHEESIYTPSRQQTWHIISGPDGNPVPFSGTFNRPGLLERRIYVREMDLPVLYRSLQALNKSTASGDVPNLCIGTSYRGFSASVIRRAQTGGGSNDRG